jgi:hypothetical protein
MDAAGWNFFLGGHLAVDDRDRPRPSRRGALDLHRKAGHREPGRRQKFQIVQFFDVAVADVPPGLVALPDQAGIFGLGEFLRGMDERRVPAPAVDAGQPHAAFEQVHRRLVAHAAAGIDEIRPAIFGAGAGIDHDDFQRRKRVADALEFGIDILGGGDITVGQVPEVELDARLQAPFQRHLVDGPCPLAAVHGRMIVVGRIEMGAVMGRELHRLHRPALSVRQIFGPEAFKESEHARQALLVIVVLNDRVDPRRIGRNVILQRHGNIDQLSCHGASSRFFVLSG